MTPKRYFLCSLAAIAAGIFLGLVFCAAFRVGAAQRSFNGSAYIRAWNDVAESIGKQNPLLNEIQDSVKRNPPAGVRDVRRAQLWDEIIAEHERQLKDFKTLRRLEQ